MHIVQGTPNLYIQEPGLLKQAGNILAEYGTSACIVTGQKSWQVVEPIFTESLQSSGLKYEVQRFGGECSYAEVARLQEFLKPMDDLVIGVGGGKVLDTAKALAAKTNRAFVAIPTLASTCAAVTPLSVIYTTEGVYQESPLWQRNTLVVLVDTEVIAHSPVRYLTSGIGDTIAKWYESSASSIGRVDNLPTVAALRTAKFARDILFEYSEQAVHDIKEQKVTSALQQVTDAVILFGGMVGGLGSTNCRAAAAHAIHNGMTAIHESKKAYHGEKVAYGILLQMLLEKKGPQEIEELLEFYKKCGLPRSFRELGINLSEVPKDLLDEVIRRSLLPDDTMVLMPFQVTESMVLAAISEAENLQ